MEKIEDERETDERRGERGEKGGKGCIEKKPKYQKRYPREERQKQNQQMQQPQSTGTETCLFSPKEILFLQDMFFSRRYVLFLWDVSPQAVHGGMNLVSFYMFSCCLIVFYSKS